MGFRLAGLHIKAMLAGKPLSLSELTSPGWPVSPHWARHQDVKAS